MEQSSSSPTGSAVTQATACVRKAHVKDVPQLHRLIGYWADNGSVLRRTLGQIYESMQEFTVVEANGRVLGGAALHIDCGDLAELRSVVVDPESHRQGVGKVLVTAVIEEARQLGVRNLFCLTDKPDYFGRFGFKEIDKADLPHKIWRDCVNCPAFPDCHETAMIISLQNPHPEA
jgi:amino-acid N-acetyltransferase